MPGLKDLWKEVMSVLRSEVQVVRQSQKGRESQTQGSTKQRWREVEVTLVEGREKSVVGLQGQVQQGLQAGVWA